MIEYAIAATAVFMGLVVLWKIRPALRKFVKITDALDVLPEFMVRTDTDLQEIRKAVFPNHGTAIPDGIERLEKDVRAVHGRLDGLEEWVQAESDDGEREHAALSVRLDRLDKVDIHVNPPDA